MAARTPRRWASIVVAVLGSLALLGSGCGGGSEEATEGSSTDPSDPDGTGGRPVTTLEPPDIDFISAPGTGVSGDVDSQSQSFEIEECDAAEEVLEVDLTGEAKLYEALALECLNRSGEAEEKLVEVGPVLSTQDGCDWYVFVASEVWDTAPSDVTCEVEGDGPEPNGGGTTTTTTTTTTSTLDGNGSGGAEYEDVGAGSVSANG